MLHVIAFALAVVSLSVLLKRKAEQLIAPVTILLMLALTALGMARQLALVDVLAIVVLALVALSAVYVLAALRLQSLASVCYLTYSPRGLCAAFLFWGFFGTRLSL